MNKTESVLTDSVASHNTARRLFVLSPLVVAFLVCVTNEVSPEQTLRFACWSAGWWVVGLACTTSPRWGSTRLSRAAYGGVLGIIAQLLAWAVAMAFGDPAAGLPILLALSLVIVGITPGTRHALSEYFSLWMPTKRYPSIAKKENAIRDKLSPRVPTYVLATWSASSLWLLAAAQAFFRDNSFSPQRASAAQDLFWHFGIAGTLKHHLVPPVSESYTGENLNYHWLSDAYMAAGSLGAHVPTVMSAERLWLIPVLLLAPALIIVVAHEISGTWLSAVPAVLVTSVATSIPILPWQHLGPSQTFLLGSPSQIFGVPMTVLALSVIARTWRSGELSIKGAAGLSALLFICAGSKSSILPVFLGGLTMTLVATFPRRGLVSSLRITGIKIWLCAVLAQALALPVFAGGSAGSKIRLFGHLRHWGVVQDLTHHPHAVGHGPFVPPGLTMVNALVILLLVCLVVASYGVGFIACSLPRTTWMTDPLPLFLSTSFLSSVIAFCLIDHTGLSESYFPMGAMPLLAILAGWGYAVLWDSSRHRRQSLVWGISIALGITFVARALPQTLPHHPRLLLWLGLPVLVWCALVVLARSCIKTGRSLAVATALVGIAIVWPAIQSGIAIAPDLTRPPPVRSAASVTAQEQQGLAWIRQHTPKDSLVATNVHCRDVKRVPFCPSSAYWTNAYAERQFFIGSWGYTDAAQKDVGRDNQPAVQQKFPDTAAFALNEAMFYSPTAEVAQKLRARGVEWLYADTRVAQLSPHIGDFAALMGRWGTVSVYRLGGTHNGQRH